MNETPEIPIADNDPALDSDFAKEMARQMRALDTYGMRDNLPNSKILAPLILTKEKKRQIPVVGDPDEITLSRLKAYYNALSALVEKNTGIMAIPILNISHEGFGRVVITAGKLVVVDKSLRDVHRFGFDSLAKMQEEADKVLAKAVELIQKYEEVARL